MQLMEGGLKIAEAVPNQRRLYRFEANGVVAWCGNYGRPEGYFATCAGGAGPNRQQRAPAGYGNRLDVVNNESTFSSAGPWLIEELREVRFPVFVGWFKASKERSAGDGKDVAQFAKTQVNKTCS